MEVQAQHINKLKDEAIDITFEFNKLNIYHTATGPFSAFNIQNDCMDTDYLKMNRATVLAKEIGQHQWHSELSKSRHGHIIVTNKNILYKDIINHDQVKKSITLACRNGGSTDFEVSLNYCEKEEHVKQIFKVVSLHNLR